MKRILLFLTYLLVTGFASVTYAQKLNLTAIAPPAVANQSQFKVTYTINASAVGFSIGEFKDFRVIIGPSTSRSQRFAMDVNGQTQSLAVTTFTYVLQALKEGTFTLPAASVTVNNQKYVSGTPTVKVLPDDGSSSSSQIVPQSQQPQSQSAGSSSRQASSSSQQSSAEELFVRVIPSKTVVYEHEPILVTIKLYAKNATVVGLTSMKFPDFKGFLSQDIPLPNTTQVVLENYNGKNYNTVILKQMLIYPQQPGNIMVELGKYEVLVRQSLLPRNRRDYFSGFMGTYRDVKRQLTSSMFKIEIKALPTPKPPSFSNAVGSFKLSSTINPTTLKVNEPVTVGITVSGTGNFRTIKNPTVTFPHDFEVYDPRVESNVKTASSGMSGSKTIESLAIPRHAGDFEIPEVKFTYFDLASKSYKTLSSQAYSISVEKGAASESAAGTVVSTGYVNKEAIKFLGSDIRYIHTDDLTLVPKAEFFFGSVAFLLWYLIPLALAVALFILFRKQAKENANIALVRTKKANKVATKRLKQAHQYLQSNQREMFYDEMLKALWGYFSDKLNIPQSTLTREAINSGLTDAGIDEELIADFNHILSTCEFARYAPSNEAGEMEQLYNDTVAKIGLLEEKIKKG